jgi:hypothetical protein
MGCVLEFFTGFYGQSTIKTPKLEVFTALSIPLLENLSMVVNADRLYLKI